MERVLKFDHRKGGFMQVGLPKTTEEFTGIRTEAAVTLRKKKRMQAMMNKRMKVSPSAPSLTLDEVISGLSLNSLNSVKALRKHLCASNFDNYELMQKCPSIVNTLSPGLCNPNSELAYEVMWCFTNLALGPAHFISDISELVPEICGYILEPKNKMLAEQACWVLGNLAADSLQLRDTIRQVCGLLKGMSRLLVFRIQSLSTVACWALCNLIRGPNFDVSMFIETNILEPVLDLTQKPIDSDMCIEALWLMTFLTTNPGNEIFERILQPKFLERCFSILETSKEPSVTIPVLRILGNILCYFAERQTFAADLRFIKALSQKIESEHQQIKRDALWTASNLIASPVLKQIVSTQEGIGLVEKLLLSLEYDNQDVKAEAGIGIYNFVVADESYFLPLIIRKAGLYCAKFFSSIVENVPVWLQFGIQNLTDPELLKVSVDFIHLCLEYTEENSLDVPEDLHFYLQSSEIQEKLENCYAAFNKDQMRLGQTEQTVKGMCTHILAKYFNSNDMIFT